MQPLSPSQDLNELNTRRIRVELKRFGLSQCGLKAELIKRLREALVKEQAELGHSRDSDEAEAPTSDAKLSEAENHAHPTQVEKKMRKRKAPPAKKNCL